MRSRILIMQVLRKPDGGSRGFGFVTFKDEMSVEKCLVMQHFLNGKQVRTSFVSLQHRITPELSKPVVHDSFQKWLSCSFSYTEQCLSSRAPHKAFLRPLQLVLAECLLAHLAQGCNLSPSHAAILLSGVHVFDLC